MILVDYLDQGHQEDHNNFDPAQESRFFYVKELNNSNTNEKIHSISTDHHIIL